jgi:hypothetical protein
VSADWQRDVWDYFVALPEQRILMNPPRENDEQRWRLLAARDPFLDELLEAMSQPIDVDHPTPCCFCHDPVARGVDYLRTGNEYGIPTPWWRRLVQRYTRRR